jgi:3-oxoacyl-[acyl-carrier-protein] synthase I
VYVHAMGMSCPVGLTWRRACAAIRAGIERKWELPYLDDDGNPLTGSKLEQLDEECSTLRARWVRLLAWSLKDALRPLSRRDVALVPVALSLPRDARGVEPTAGPLLEELRAIWGEDLGLDPRLVHIVCDGAFGGLRALAWARERVAERGACVVGAADSLIGAQVLLELLERDRLLTERNPDGVIPGEGSACVLLHASRLDALASIRGVGFGREPAGRNDDVPLRAEGLVAAVRGALSQAGCALHEVDLRVADAAGDGYAFKEQALLVTRLLRQRKEQFPLLLPAEALGDTGAAAGVLGLVVAVEALVYGKASGPRALVLAGNDRGDRAAVIVEAMTTLGS